MSVAIMVFIVFPFTSLRPVARLGQEAVDKAVERSESWGAADEDRGACEACCPIAVQKLEDVPGTPNLPYGQPLRSEGVCVQRPNQDLRRGAAFRPLHYRNFLGYGFSVKTTCPCHAEAT